MSHPPSSSSPDPARRSESSRRSILAAAIAVTGEFGYERASVEAIAKRAGVGKQTIYRWWPSKGAVILEALGDRVANVIDLPFPDTGDVVADMRANLIALTGLLQPGDVRTAYQAVVAAAQSDPALSKAHYATFIEPPTVVCRQLLRRAQERGEIRPNVDLQVIIDLLWGAMYYRLLLDTRTLEPQQIDDAMDIVLAGVRPQD